MLKIFMYLMDFIDIMMFLVSNEETNLSVCQFSKLFIFFEQFRYGCLLDDVIFEIFH